MTKRAPWPMVVAPGTKHVGTATIREEFNLAMPTAQRLLYQKTGVPPQSSALDDPTDPFDPSLIRQHPATLGPKKPSKYRNTRCEHQGIKFDSQKERSRWFHLIQLQAAGAIRDLQLQVPFILTERKRRSDGKWERAWKYVADFVYLDVETGKQVVEDVKSEATRKNRAYVRARKAMLAIHEISILET